MCVFMFSFEKMNIEFPSFVVASLSVSFCFVAPLSCSDRPVFESCNTGTAPLRSIEGDRCRIGDDSKLFGDCSAHFRGIIARRIRLLIWTRHCTEVGDR